MPAGCRAHDDELTQQDRLTDECPLRGRAGSIWKALTLACCVTLGTCPNLSVTLLFL